MILKRFIARKIDEITEEAIGVSTSQLKTMMKEIKETPAPKSVSGATRIYLNQIERDFPEFSESEAEREIRGYIEEYVSDKNGRNTHINQIAISGYRKAETYATIQYQCSVGFDTSNQSRCETRYCLEYTLKLVEEGVASAAMKCPNCGAALEATDVSKCPYCDVKIIRDTILNWDVTSIKER